MHIKSPSEFVVAGVDVKDGDLIKLLNEGEYRLLPDKSREVLTFKVEIPNKETKSLSLNATSQTRLLTSWGDDSSKWVGKRCSVEVVKQNVKGQMKNVIYLYPEGTVSELKETTIPDEEDPDLPPFED